jgi:hypothetical protein
LRERLLVVFSGQLERRTAFSPLPELLNRLIATFVATGRAAESFHPVRDSTCRVSTPPLRRTSNSQVLGDCASRETPMLWTVFAILLLLWLLGWGFHVAGSLIHLILVIALVVLVIELITGRRATV